MQQTNHEGPPRSPAGADREVCEYISCTMTTVLGNGQYADHDGNYTSKGPEDGERLLRVVRDWEPNSTNKLTYIEKR